MATVIAFIVRGENAYGVSFPDFPGALTGGDTLDEAMNRAHVTLQAHVEALIEAGIPLPPIHSLEEIDTSEADLVTAVKIDLPGKSVRVNVSFDERLLERIDRAANGAGESRSAFLANAAKQRLAV